MDSQPKTDDVASQDERGAQAPEHLHWPPSVLQAQEQPWKYNFIGLLRRLCVVDGRNRQAPPVGMARRPQQEGLRLGQQASMAFAPREIASVHLRPDNRVEIKVFGLGLLGPNGPLPIHITEQVRERSQALRDTTLANFLDMFHHRYLTHLYRAWAQGQAAAGLDRAHNESFTRYVARLCGDEPEQVQGSALAPHARWASSAHRVRSARDPDGLVSTLGRYFRVPVRLREFVLHWVALDKQDQTQLAHPRASGMLGQGAVVGEYIPDRQSRFRLVIGPLDLSGYLRLTPQGSASGQDLPALVELVRSFIGLEYDWEVEVRIHASATEPCSLGDSAQLGWSSWMGREPGAQADISGMVLQPEHYMHRRT